MNMMKSIQLFYCMDESMLNNIKESDYAEFYDKFISELDLLLNNKDLELAYKQLNYIRIELVCLKEFQKEEHYLRIFYLTKSIYALDVNLQMVTWKISGILSKSNNNLINIVTKWTGSVTELVELGYALIESKRVNNGNIQIKYFMSQLSLFFDFQISDCFNIYREIRKRKLNRTAFLDELRNGLIQRMDNML